MIMRKVTFAAAAAALAACSTAQSEIDAVSGMTPTGSSFQKALVKEYRALAIEENDEGDINNAYFFIQKARMAAEGKAVGPQSIDDRKLPTATIAEIAGAREKLLATLATNATQRMPADAARAQAMFDCWLEEQEENIQPHDIARCRGAFETALTTINAKPVAAAPAPRPAPKGLETPRPFVIYFSHDSVKLDTAAIAVIGDAITTVNSNATKALVITGHTDTLGPNEYNKKLGDMRAQAVAKALAARGLGKGAIRTQSMGEDTPAVKTADNVKEPQNRRAIIELADR